MLTFPKQAAVGKIMPKGDFYKNLKLSGEIRKGFVSDIKNIVLEYKLAADTINIPRGEEVAEILILSMELKKPDIDYRIIENIARQNYHKLLFLLKNENQGQLAIYYSKVYKTDWLPLTEANLELKGLDLDKVWEGFIEQIALSNPEGEILNEELSLKERLKRKDDHLKLVKKINKLERLSRKEIQPKKKFKLYSEIQELKKQMGAKGEDKQWKN